MDGFTALNSHPIESGPGTPNSNTLSPFSSQTLERLAYRPSAGENFTPPISQGFNTPANGSDMNTSPAGTDRSDSPPSDFARPPAANSTQPIAIIGMGCRLPGEVTTPYDLWELCTRSRKGFSTIPGDRFNAEAFYHPNPQKIGAFNNGGGYFLGEDVALFDAPFFNITEAEAKAMDPQQRLALEVTYEALEAAGVPKESIAGKPVGVFAGGSFADYELHNCRDIDTAPPFAATGSAACMLSNRISYYFDLRGPSFTVDTACSSSLTALHQAMTSMRNGESKMAIVAGAHLNILPDYFVTMSTSQLFNDHGQSFPFDHRGTSGFARGEGVGAVILKPLDQAIADNDRVRAVIVNSGVNQDGRTPGITVPSGEMQERLMRSTYAQAKIDPSLCGYVEAHGTGTKVGDPIEASALHRVFGEGRSQKDPLYFGSIKANIGHLEGASGLASVMKAALTLEKGLILPNVNFEKPNPKIPMDDWNMRVPTNVTLWPTTKKYISICNYGFGGGNAHAVLERAPKRKQNTLANASAALAERPDQKWKLFTISANSKDSLEKLCKEIGVYLETRPEVFEKRLGGDLAYTLGQRRSHLQWRIAMPAYSADKLGETLAAGKVNMVRAKEEPRIGFVCTGQGAQWFGMGRELIQAYPKFSQAIKDIDLFLRHLGADFSLLDELHKDERTTNVNVPYIAQPACTAIQVALIDLLESWNVRPECTVGHSSGEIAAAYAAGMLDMKSAMTLAYHRGKGTVNLKERYPNLNGRMLAVGMGVDVVRPMLAELKSGYATIACVNSPSSVTVSGEAPALEELKSIVKAQSKLAGMLKVDVAYHSKHMGFVADEYEAAIKHIKPIMTPKARMHSSLLGRVISPEELQPSYWVANLVSPVEFCSAVQTMVKPADPVAHPPPTTMIEIGPHHALEGPFKDILKSSGEQAMKITYQATLARNKDANETILQGVASLFMKGAVLNFGAINTPWSDNRVPTLLNDLPKYPWSHGKRFWNDARVAEKHLKRPFAYNDIVGTLSEYSDDLAPTWRKIIQLNDLPWLRQHKMQGMTVYPMAGYLAMAMEASAQRTKLRGGAFDRFDIREVVSSRALILEEDAQVEANINLRPQIEGTRGDSDAWDEFRIRSFSKGKGWVEHCRGLIAARQGDAQNAVDGKRSATAAAEFLNKKLAEVKSRSVEPVNTPLLYETLAEVGAGYGPCFQGLDKCTGSDTHAMADLIVPDTKSTLPKEHETDMVIHPAFFDQFIQIVWPIFGAGRGGLNTLYMPSSIKHVSVRCDTPKRANDRIRVYGIGDPNAANPRPTKFNLWATELDGANNTFLKFEDLIMTPIHDAAGSGSDTARELCFKTEWEPAFQPAEAAAAEEAPKTSKGDFVFVGPVSSQQELANSLAGLIEPFSSTGAPETTTFDKVAAKDKIVVVLSELEKPMLANLSADAFAAVQKTVTEAAGVVWVVRGAYKNATSPDLNMVAGLSRSIRSETMAKFAVLDLDPSSSQETAANAVFEVVKKTFIEDAPADADMEFMERAGKLLVPRVVNDSAMNDFVHRETQDAAPFAQPFAQAGRRFKLDIGMPGALDTLHFTDDNKEAVPLAADEIEIAVKATSMNFKDIVIAMGQVPSPYIGVECAGVVSSVGGAVSNVKVGDEVMTMSEGAYSTFARCKSTSAARIPEGMSLADASTIPVVFCTAYYALMDLARLEPEDSVLIHAGAGGVGQAAIMLAKMVGADVFTTVGSPSKKQFLMETYGIPEDRIFFSRDTSFGPAIRRATGGRGVDVVLNSLAGDILRETWECVAHFGRFVEIGKRDILANSGLGMAMFEHNATFSSVDLTVVAAEKPRLMKRLMDDVGRLMAAGTIKPISPITTYPISQTETAFRNLQSGKAMGKVVVVPNAGDEVKATARKTQADLLRPDASYLIVGGTGGLGRSMTRWMAAKGARFVVLISRSGKVDADIAKLTADMAAQGVQVLVKPCDAAEPAHVARLLNEDMRAASFPAVGGVVYGAMVLRDVLFERMSHAEWEAVVRAKVPGAWNLHNELQRQNNPLDFFVALSSVAGAVGNRGQAAYAAANTFLDAFCAFRNALNLPATSLDLTAVTGVGYLADNKERAAEVTATLGAETADEKEVLALLGAAILGQVNRHSAGHVITGLKVQPGMREVFWLNDARFAVLKEAAAALSADADGDADNKPLNKRLEDAAELDEAKAALYGALTTKLSALLMIPVEDMEPTAPVTAYGLDSLVAIEVRNWIVREVEANLQVLELLSSGSLMALCETILRKSKLKIKALAAPAEGKE